jgi:RNA polymerase subunit RPABC4/transcription elongation factor Spt4
VPVGLRFASAQERKEELMRCQECDARVKADDEFCPECGADLPARQKAAKRAGRSNLCPNCSAEVGDGEEFCPDCGVAVRSTADEW